MDPSEYDLEFFRKNGFHRRRCTSCRAMFWSLGDLDRCQEDPCTPYAFLGHPAFSRPFSTKEMRETYYQFFERRGHTRIGRYPTVARWRNDVFFTQASIYDFQPWVTNGTIPPPANPLVISQPCLRFIDLDEVGRSGRHFTEFEMMAHHAFNRPDHQVYFKDRCVELCHELLTQELGADPQKISYKEEEWEGGGNLGPSLSVGILGLELATLVFMEYVRDGDRLKPMPMTVVDTGYGLERFTWVSQGTRTAYEAVFGAEYDELRRTFPPAETAVLIDHARAVNFLLTDGVVPSNSKEGYFARLLLRRMIRTLAKVPEAPDLLDVLDRVGRDLAHSFPEVGSHREDLHHVVEAEMGRFSDALARARGQIRRHEDRLEKEGKRVGVGDLIQWYDSLGVPPDVAIAELQHPPEVPADFYAQVDRLHESPTADEPTRPADAAARPEIPQSVPETDVRYYLDPYTLAFDAHVVWSQGPFVVLDRTYFYPTGGGQITDTGHLGDVPVEDVLRESRWVVHRLDRSSPFAVGDKVRGRVDGPRRRQLMQHHTATHLLNGALREVLGPHVWQAGAYKGLDEARIDITHYRPLDRAETRRVERRVNEIVREDRPVKSYFESRTEAERRFGFTLYQGGAVPGGQLRIVEVDGFDVEACGGTHCTHTSEVGLVTLLGTERIQDGIVRLQYAAGDRALDVTEERRETLEKAGRLLGVPPASLPEGIERLQRELLEARRRTRGTERSDLSDTAERLLTDGKSVVQAANLRVVSARVELDRARLMELSRLLTRSEDQVAVLASEVDGQGILFIGSTARAVPANEVLAASAFPGKGGGNPSAATAVGEPGRPLDDAMRRAVDEAVRRATSAVP